MKMSEKFWLSVYICSVVVPSILIYIEWEVMRPIIFDGATFNGFFYGVLTFASVWVGLNLFAWGCFAVSSIPELIKLFNEWLDKQDGDEA